MRRAGGDVDDVSAAAARHHVAPNKLDKQEGRFRIHREYQIPCGFVGLQHICGPSNDAGAIDQDVDAAERVQGCLDGGRYSRRIGEIEALRYRFSAASGDQRARLGQIFRVPIESRHGRAGGGEQQRSCPADSACGTRNDRALAGERAGRLSGNIGLRRPPVSGRSFRKKRRRRDTTPPRRLPFR
jgi:hypothetical protein